MVSFVAWIIAVAICGGCASDTKQAEADSSQSEFPYQADVKFSIDRESLAEIGGTPFDVQRAVDGFMAAHEQFTLDELEAIQFSVEREKHALSRVAKVVVRIKKQD